jgi:hypothetical protein
VDLRRGGRDLAYAKRALNNPETDPVDRVNAEWILHQKTYFIQFLTKNEAVLEDVASGKVLSMSGE